MVIIMKYVLCVFLLCILAVPAPSSEPTPVPDSEEASEPSSAPELHEGDISIDGVCFYKLPALTEAELEALWGPVRETERFQLVQEEQEEVRYYDGVTIRCTFYEDEAGTHYWLGALAYTRPDLAYVRGVRVGDTMETVLNTFRDNGERATQETPYGLATILYGDPQHMQSFGIILYGDDSPVEIMYQEDGIGVIFTLDSEQKVSAIEVLGPLSAIQERLRVV